ncbi:MAG: WbqC family protein [Flammeovirgaceae bacterium]|nr:MAG: WbqC family protein [Flammeovirgaceae bacterium]
MKLAIMQPYFFPYIGYFQLMNAVDQFIIYDNIEFSRKGWIHRNRILINNSPSYISLPIKNDSDYLSVCDRYLAESWPVEKSKLINRITEAYRKAPYFKPVMSVVESSLDFDDHNLFRFIYHSLQQIRAYLNIVTPMQISSQMDIDHSLKAQDKVLALCKASSTSVYINPIGGVDLYSRSRFAEEGIELLFLKADPITYKQFSGDFIPSLSIIDVMMFNSVDEVRNFLMRFSLN